MSTPKIPAYQALHQLMFYLYHHPHKTIMYSGQVQDYTKVQCYFNKGIAEFKSVKKNTLITYNDADQARDLRDLLSVTSTLHLINGTAVLWSSRKQIETSLHPNGDDIRALQTGVKQALQIRLLLANLSIDISEPTIVHEDNHATIQQVLKDRLTPQIKHLDVLITWLHEHHLKGTFVPSYTDSINMLADYNTKPTGRVELFNKHMLSIGYEFYPIESTPHQSNLQLHKYNMHIHQISQNLNYKYARSTDKTALYYHTRASKVLPEQGRPNHSITSPIWVIRNE